MKISAQLQGVIIVLIGVICFSSKAVFIKLSYEHNVDSTTLLFLRLAFALPVYITILIAQYKKNGPVKTSLILKSGGIGLIGYYVASWLDFKGLSYISASMERLILFAYPTFVVLISAIVLKNKITLPQILALILAYIGLAVIILYRDAETSTNTNFTLGASLIVLSALTYAAYLVGSGEIMKQLGAGRFTAIAMLFSCCGVVIHQFVFNTQDLLNFDREVYVYALWMAGIATVIPSFLISYGIKLIGASNASIIGAAGPVSTIVLAYIFLGESINIIQIVGTILVMLGVVIISTQKNKKP